MYKKLKYTIVMSRQCSLASHVETASDDLSFQLLCPFFGYPCDDGSMHVCATDQLKVGSYEEFFPIALVLGVKYPMHHNFLSLMS